LKSSKAFKQTQKVIKTNLHNADCLECSFRFIAHEPHRLGFLMHGLVLCRFIIEYFQKLSLATTKTNPPLSNIFNDRFPVSVSYNAGVGKAVIHGLRSRNTRLETRNTQSKFAGITAKCRIRLRNKHNNPDVKIYLGVFANLCNIHQDCCTG
jgi:hypothetical protein